MPLMPTHTEELSLSFSLAETMETCAEAIRTLGWRIVEQSLTRLKCAEVKPQLVSFSLPVQVEIVLKAEPSGATRLSLNGSTFGLGSLHVGYLQEQVQNLRHTIEHTVSRKTQKPERAEPAPAPSAESQSQNQNQAAVTLASELERLAKLHASGALSDEEFRQAKQRLLEQAAPATKAASNNSRSVVINGLRLSDEELRQLEERFKQTVADGSYWYDTISGAWGREKGPTLGFTRPHMELGGPLRADASNGNTGVFFNGRELHQLDVLALRQLTPYVLPGRYWLDARGIGGYEGGPPIFDLRSLARAAGGTRGGAWSYMSPHSNTGAGAPQGFFNF